MIEIEQRGRPEPGGSQPLHVEFLYWEECPSHERALGMLRDILREEDAKADLLITRVDTEGEAHMLQFPGSPTIRINGADIDGNPALPVGLSCRTYRVGGKMSPLPSRDQLRQAIRGAMRAPKIDDPVLAPCEGPR